MCLAQGHNTATPVSLQPMAPQTRVKHSMRWRKRNTISTKGCGPTRERTHFSILEVHRSQITSPTRYELNTI